MFQYERIDISDKSNKSVECMTCHYWYFKDIGFKYQPYYLANSWLDNKGVL